jgi:hypothetical protein
MCAFAHEKSGLTAMLNLTSRSDGSTSRRQGSDSWSRSSIPRTETRQAAWRLESRVQKLESRVDRARVRPILGRPTAEPGRLHSESVARALPRALPVRCLFRGARRILRRLVLKPRFSQGFRGLFESCPIAKWHLPSRMARRGWFTAFPSGDGKSLQRNSTIFGMRAR